MLYHCQKSFQFLQEWLEDVASLQLTLGCIEIFWRCCFLHSVGNSILCDHLRRMIPAHDFSSWVLMDQTAQSWALLQQFQQLAKHIKKSSAWHLWPCASIIFQRLFTARPNINASWLCYPLVNKHGNGKSHIKRMMFSFKFPVGIFSFPSLITGGYQWKIDVGAPCM